MKPSLPDSLTDDKSPGVPGFRTWWGIYLFVFIVFVLVVGLLTFFSHWFA